MIYDWQLKKFWFRFMGKFQSIQTSLFFGNKRQNIYVVQYVKLGFLARLRDTQ